MKTILVSGASGIVGYGCLKSLRMGTKKYRLIGTTIHEDSIAPAFCDVFEKAPLTSDADYIKWLEFIIDKYCVDLIIPGIEADLYKWCEQRQRISDKTNMVMNNPALVELCQDKWNFYQKLNASAPELTIPSRIEGSFEEFKNLYGLPFLIKPRRGFGSKGIVIIHNELEFINHQKLLQQCMAQPIVGSENEEYTVSAFFSASGELCCFMALRRRLSKEGFTEFAQTTDVPGVRPSIQRLGEIFKPVGPTNFQFRVQDNALFSTRCFEFKTTR